MPRLGLGIHELLSSVANKLVDPKAKPWGDALMTQPVRFAPPNQPLANPLPAPETFFSPLSKTRLAERH
jgi:hypothetical protein